MGSFHREIPYPRVFCAQPRQPTGRNNPKFSLLGASQSMDESFIFYVLDFYYPAAQLNWPPFRPDTWHS